MIFFATKCHATIEPRIFRREPNNSSYYYIYTETKKLRLLRTIWIFANTLLQMHNNAQKKSKRKLVDEYMTNTDLCPITANSNTHSSSSVHLCPFYLPSGTSNANDHTHTATKFFPPLTKLVLQRDGVKVFYLRSVHTLW